MIEPEWVTLWCRQHLGSVPAEVLHSAAEKVFGLRLADGREVAVKARPDQNGREATCVEVQRFVAAQGFPAPAPLTGVTVEAGRAIHAEEWRPGGHIRDGDDPRRFAELLAELVTLAEGIQVGGTAPGAVQPLRSSNPHWTMPQVRDRMAAVYLPRVLGHGAWKPENLRWQGDEPYAVHDWDNLCWLPEAMIAGMACGSFAGLETSIAASQAFLDAYQAKRRPFDDNEIEVAWATSIRPATPESQVEERLRRAGA
jgi:hypothetical protein